MASRKLVIEVVGDASKLDKTFKQASASTNKFGRSLDGVTTGAALSTRGVGGLSAAVKSGGIAVGLGLAAQKALQFGEAASDLNEQISKSRQVFGPASAEVEAFSRTTARALGISQTAALEAAGTFGNLFATVRLAPQQSAAMSKALVQLASDLASFNNANPAEVLDALRSGLIGEAEPLRRFGVLLSEARVQQRAMADTGKTTAKSLTDQEKTIARYEVILRDTVKAQGDFARTSGGLANQQRILKAQTADLAASIGKVLLPALTQGVTFANEFAEAAGHLGGVFRDLGVSGADVGKGLSAAFAATPGLQLMIGEVKILNSLFGGTKKQLSDIGPLAQSFADSINGIDLNPAGFKDLGNAVRDAGRAAQVRPPAFGEPGFKVGKAPPVPLGPSVEQRNRFFDDMIGRREDRSQDIASLQGQVKELTVIEGLIQKRIDATKDITRRLNLEDELVRVRRQRRGIEDQIASDSKARVDALREAQRQAREATRQAQELAAEREKTARQLRQSVALGDVTPGVDNLRKQLSSLSDRLGDSGVDLGSKLRQGLEGARKVLSGELGKATLESRQRIQVLFDTIRGEFDRQQSKGPLTKTKSLSTKRVLAGLGLSPADERELRARLSHFNTAGRALAGARTAPGPRQNPAVTAQDVKFQIAIDGRPVEHSVTRNQQKRARRNPPTRRGR